MFQKIRGLLLCLVLFALGGSITFFLPSASNWLLGLVAVATVISVPLLGLKREHSRWGSEARTKVAIWVLVLLSIQFIVGIIMGLYANNVSFPKLLYAVLMILFAELLRYMLCNNAGSVKELVLIGTLFTFLEVILPIRNATLLNPDDFVEFFIVSILPVISKNILLTYLSKKVGYSPCILYRLMMETYIILSPIIPSFGEFVDATILIVFPFVLFYRFYLALEPKKKTRNFLRKSSLWRKTVNGIYITIAAMIIYFTSGAFRFYALTIVTGSMIPNINIGDVVIVDKYYKDHVDEINLGDVLIFNKNNVLVSHRVVEIKEKNNEFSFQTKGDNNESVDSWIVKSEDVIGVSRMVVPVIGYPVVVWNEVINKG